MISVRVCLKKTFMQWFPFLRLKLNLAVFFEQVFVNPTSYLVYQLYPNQLGYCIIYTMPLHNASVYTQISYIPIYIIYQCEQMLISKQLHSARSMLHLTYAMTGRMHKPCVVHKIKTNMADSKTLYLLRHPMLSARYLNYL